MKSGVWSFGGKSQGDFLFLFAMFLNQPPRNNLRLFLSLKILYGTTMRAFLFLILRRTVTLQNLVRHDPCVVPFLNLRRTGRNTEGHADHSLRVLFYLQAAACKFYFRFRESFMNPCRDSFYFCFTKVLAENRKTIFFYIY